MNKHPVNHYLHLPKRRELRRKPKDPISVVLGDHGTGHTRPLALSGPPESNHRGRLQRKSGNKLCPAPKKEPTA